MNENYRVLQSVIFLGIGTAIGASFELARDVFYWGSFGYVELPAGFSMIWITVLALAAIYLEVLMMKNDREQLLAAFNTESGDSGE